ncbi:hypothetical protein HaLaN_25573, partial [Haematococcus lacustris]
MCADVTCWGARIVTLLLLVGSTTCTSSSGSPDASIANCTNVVVASNQCYSSTAAFIASVVSRETALPVGSGVDSELQGFLQNKTSELLNNCFPTAGAIKIRVPSGQGGLAPGKSATGVGLPLRLLVNNGWETFIQVPLQDYKAATGIDVVMHALPYNKVSTAILQQLKVNASDAVDSTTAPAYDAFIIPGSLVGDL